MKKVLKSNKGQVLSLMGICFLLISLSTLVLLLIDFSVAWSFWTGGVAVFLTSMYQICLLFKEKYASSAKRALWRFYRSEVFKFVFVGVCFVALMRIESFNVLAFVIGILSMQFGVWIFMPLMFVKRS